MPMFLLVTEFRTSQAITEVYCLSLLIFTSNIIVFFQGDEADCMYFVESGMASIRIRNQVCFFMTTTCFTDLVCGCESSSLIPDQ